MSATEDVDARLEDGWRPSLGDRRWVRDGTVVVVPGEDRFEADDGEVAEMTPEEEQVLIERVWTESEHSAPPVAVVTRQVDDGTLPTQEWNGQGYDIVDGEETDDGVS